MSKKIVTWSLLVVFVLTIGGLFFLQKKKSDIAPLTLTTLYGDFTIAEPVLIELLQDPYMQRLKHIRQYGTNYYTIKKQDFNRFDHSVGVFVLLRKYGASLNEQIAGLLHDVSHTVFSHCGDYLFKVSQLDGSSYQDTIHVHHPFLLGQAALKASKKLKIPLIYTYHTLYDHYLHYVPLPQIITRPIVNTLVQTFCKKVQGIIAPSNAVKERLTACSISTKTEIIPSAISSLFFQKKHHEISLDPPFHLLSVSRFTKEKNIYFLLDMLALLDHNKFIATFAGYGSEYSSLQNYAYTIKKLSPHLVKFIEKPSKQQLKELYHTAHLFIFASQTETQGLVLAEAMAHGIPVIALNGPGQQDIIKNGLNGFLVTTLDEMKAKIEYCCASEKQYKLMQHHASHTAQEYSSNILIEKLLRFYYNVLAKV